MADTYNFDNRLIGMSLKITPDNYVDNMLKINGIYYAVDQILLIGYHVTITAVVGNKLSITINNTSHSEKKEIKKHDHNSN